MSILLTRTNLWQQRYLDKSSKALRHRNGKQCSQQLILHDDDTTLQRLYKSLKRSDQIRQTTPVHQD